MQAESIAELAKNATPESVERLRGELVRLEDLLVRLQAVLPNAASNPEAMRETLGELRVLAGEVTGRRHSFQTLPGALKALDEVKAEVERAKTATA